MRTEEWFVKLVVKKDSGISEQDAKKLFWSLAKTVAFRILGKRQTERARADEDKLQREMVRKINFSALDENACTFFEKVRETERQIREDPENAKQSLHVIERFVLESRIKLFSDFLKFSPGDAEKVGQEIERIEKEERNKAVLKYGLGAAGIAALGFALYQIFKPSEKENKPIEKK